MLMPRVRIHAVIMGKHSQFIADQHFYTALSGLLTNSQPPLPFDTSLGEVERMIEAIGNWTIKSSKITCYAGNYGWGPQPLI